jgi:hypothetical protein
MPTFTRIWNELQVTTYSELSKCLTAGMPESRCLLSTDHTPGLFLQKACMYFGAELNAGRKLCNSASHEQYYTGFLIYMYVSTKLARLLQWGTCIFLAFIAVLIITWQLQICYCTVKIILPCVFITYSLYRKMLKINFIDHRSIFCV